MFLASFGHGTWSVKAIVWASYHGMCFLKQTVEYGTSLLIVLHLTIYSKVIGAFSAVTEESVFCNFFGLILVMIGAA